MSSPTEPRRAWRPGDELLYRFRRPDGSTGQIHPATVVADDDRGLVCWVPAGTAILGTRLSDGRRVRDLPLAERFAARRVHFRDRWRGVSTLRLVPERDWWSVWWFFEPDGAFRNWYVNLEIPLGRWHGGVDRIDGVLDLVVTPDRRWSWKDEDEAAQALAVGRLTPEQLDRLRAEGERMIALAEAGRFPFDGTWCDFRPDPAWPVPSLPDLAEAR
ncbi:Protein of unknown function (DUF402) [Streptoalloteichus tenebrarius]|uniref:DUF402 domain-containing protein n=1 Tax=Streptoalloteichus tenebrarius (strain ATCC 17920 / DSM 40477 / JCM 4838 / CBS 697.72 / NBRC 16177 / NCIMB 11028 / NRRL B-12390 / A12253. 1 / ISP 5477) TaxID=1933 RepID=A0ABT1HX23_STRSD|nr:DUF402 domain-containing protein [Streptoalloteichus tenebrarius]MCP2260072.1 Protein of unknown function (DUF402) [Streptoalloteichus tenebrarius]BFF00609.1 DUF402 domain-containing protein [Streptoalloteichus tenebrarius]